MDERQRNRWKAVLGLESPEQANPPAPVPAPKAVSPDQIAMLLLRGENERLREELRLLKQRIPVALRDQPSVVAEVWERPTQSTAMLRLAGRKGP